MVVFWNNLCCYVIIRNQIAVLLDEMKSKVIVNKLIDELFRTWSDQRNRHDCGTTILYLLPTPCQLRLWLPVAENRSGETWIDEDDELYLRVWIFWRSYDPRHNRTLILSWFRLPTHHVLIDRWSRCSTIYSTPGWIIWHPYNRMYIWRCVANRFVCAKLFLSIEQVWWGWYCARWTYQCFYVP